MIETVKHPPGFRVRRGINWAFVGLLYTSFYMCRYNLPIANAAIRKEFGFTKGEMGLVITTAFFAYACGQIINGLLTDRLGGKCAMLIGAAGTIAMNFLFGVASFWGILGLFVAIRGLDGYLQSFGAPGMIKINAAWFRPNERGRFAGIFGFMINLGRFAPFESSPAPTPALGLSGKGSINGSRVSCRMFIISIFARHNFKHLFSLFRSLQHLDHSSPVTSPMPFSRGVALQSRPVCVSSKPLSSSQPRNFTPLTPPSFSWF